jgi:hypothetical protein
MLLAEIADKMPTIEVMWTQMLMAAGVCSLITAAATLVSKYLGLAPLLLIAFLTVMVASPQGSWDEAIVRELGKSYLYQQRLSDCLPLVCSFLTWLNVMWIIRSRQVSLEAS